LFTLIKMDGNKRLSAARVSNLGQVNEAFLTSMDENDHAHQEIGLKVMSLSSDGNSESLAVVETDRNERDSWLSSSPVSSEKNIKVGDLDDGEEIIATDGNNALFIDEKNRHCYEESITTTPYGMTSCQASYPNQPHQYYDLNLNNSSPTTFFSSFDNLGEGKIRGRMKEDLEPHSETQESPVILLKQNEKEKSKGVSQSEYTAIDLGLHKDEIQDGGISISVSYEIAPSANISEKDRDNSVHEVGDLDVSIRSDATEFFYTPDISPARSPIDGYVVENKRGVKFCEKSIEIGHDLLETSLNHLDESSVAEERVVGYLDQEYLRRMVDPNSRFFVCI